MTTLPVLQLAGEDNFYAFQQILNTCIGNMNKEEPVSDSWSTKAKAMLLDFAKKISLSDSPLDEMIDKLGGVKCVDEMTGRRGRILRHSPTDQPCYELRATDIDSYGGIESLNVQERNMFMQGKKLVAIISDAASTGISLHADSRVGNQRRRVHLTMELPWSADKAVQQLGRSHRSNQSSGPLYKLLTTDLGGERRFAAAVTRRLQSLGALTKGDRRAATGANLAEFNFDTQYGRDALRAMYHHICTRMLVPGINLSNITNDLTFDDFNLIMQESLVLMGLVEVESIRIGAGTKDKDTGDVSKFLNRILGLSVSKQNLIFTYFTECMKLMIQNAKAEGRYNEGMLDITDASVEMVGEAQELFRDLKKGHVDTKYDLFVIMKYWSLFDVYITKFVIIIEKLLIYLIPWLDIFYL